MTSLLFLSQIASTWFLTGLIWTIQRVHYPYLAYTEAPDFVEAHGFHSRRITALVGLAMPIEAAGAVALLWLRPEVIAPTEAILGAALVGIIWLSTIFLQIPCHRRLSLGPDPATLHQLVASNWIRTVAWSVRAGLMLLWIARAIS